MKALFQDRFLSGIIIGFLGPIVGSIIYYLLQHNAYSIQEFWVFIKFSRQISQLLSMGAILNLALVYLFVNINRMKMAKGVITSTFLLAAFSIVYLLIHRNWGQSYL